MPRPEESNRGAKAVTLPPIDATPEEIAQALFPPQPPGSPENGVDGPGGTGQAARGKVDATKRGGSRSASRRGKESRPRSNPHNR